MGHGCPLRVESGYYRSPAEGSKSGARSLKRHRTNTLHAFCGPFADLSKCPHRRSLCYRSRNYLKLDASSGHHLLSKMASRSNLIFWSQVGLHYAKDDFADRSKPRRMLSHQRANALARVRMEGSRSERRPQKRPQARSVWQAEVQGCARSRTRRARFNHYHRRALYIATAKTTMRTGSISSSLRNVPLQYKAKI